jgi:hypothetical protein
VRERKRVYVCVGMCGVCRMLNHRYHHTHKSPTRACASGTQVDIERCIKVAPLLDTHHRLLVTLLLINAACMEVRLSLCVSVCVCMCVLIMRHPKTHTQALPIFLNRIVPEWLAIVISVSAVLVFGEILPQAVCTKNPLAIGSAFAWWVVCSCHGLTIILLCMLTIPLSLTLTHTYSHSHSRTHSQADQDLHGSDLGAQLPAWETPRLRARVCICVSECICVCVRVCVCMQGVLHSHVHSPTLSRAPAHTHTPPVETRERFCSSGPN